MLGDQVGLEVDGAPTALSPSLVTASVCGISVTENTSPRRRVLIVRLTPSTAIEPFAASDGATLGAAPEIVQLERVARARAARRPCPRRRRGRDHVAAQRVAQLQRPLEVDAAPGSSAPSVVSASVSGPRSAANRPARALDDRQADAVDGDAGAERQRLDGEVGDDDQARDRRLLGSSAIDSTVPRASTIPVNMMQP